MQILREHGGVDLDTYKRPDSNKPIWQEIREVQGQRNSILHRAEAASDEQAALALGVAQTIIEELFPAVVKKWVYIFTRDLESATTGDVNMRTPR